MNKKAILLIACILIVSMLGVMFTGCGKKETPEKSGTGENGDGTTEQPTEEPSDGGKKSGEEEITFPLKEPAKFTMLYRDHPSYPYREDWILWDEIKKRTNVELELTIVPMSDYEQKRNLLISTGEAPEIVPSTYPGQEVNFIPAGAIIPVSDYIHLMPNFSRQIEEWNLQEDLKTIKQKDGKFYVLPGLREIAVADYSLAIRTDIFEKHNIPIPESWEDLYNALKKLKELYPDTYPFSDRWKGDALLNFASLSFGVQGGWGAGNGIYYYRDRDEFGFYPITDEYKEMLKYFNRLVKEGLMDPESFTQEDEIAVNQKFATGKSFVISTNTQEIISMRQKMKETLGEGNFKVDMLPPLEGPKGRVISGMRLDNGIVITKKALDNPNFEALMKFVDWLWYSEEGQTLTRWGVEGVTYKKVGDKFELLPGIKAGYLGINVDDENAKDLRNDFGMGNGVFIFSIYNGHKELMYSYMTEEARNFIQKANEICTLRPPAPPVLMDEVEREEANMISQSLMDYVKQMTLQFITGQADIEKDWDAFVQECKAKGSDRLVQMTNEIYQETKDILE
ncbi:ABC transporter substrate-binding protein [Caldicoprobacter faecalis]|nr:extracellular solute-binding protein [Caldicoprobacter faecalis]